ncbi:hypothetical protein ACHAPI_008413 [Fusarium lateritium]
MSLRPNWYYRVVDIARSRGPGENEQWQTCPEDYDVDLSDAPDCTSECGSECEHLEYSSDSSSVSWGMDLDQFHRMSRERNERKKEWKDVDGGPHGARSPSPEYDKTIMKEVMGALEDGRMSRNRPPLRRLTGRTFRLYSEGYKKFSSGEGCPSKYVEFYGAIGEYETDDVIKRTQQSTQGHIYLRSNTICELDYFMPPTFPSNQIHKVTGNRGWQTLYFQFVSDDCLVVRIPRDLVFSCDRVKPWLESAPGSFTFYGIAEDFPDEDEEDEEEEKEEEDSLIESRPVVKSIWREEKKDRRRSASPAEFRQTSIRDFFS